MSHNLSYQAVERAERLREIEMEKDLQKTRKSHSNDTDESQKRARRDDNKLIENCNNVDEEGRDSGAEDDISCLLCGCFDYEGPSMPTVSLSDRVAFDSDTMLLCDGCNGGFHALCLGSLFNLIF